MSLKSIKSQLLIFTSLFYSSFLLCQIDSLVIHRFECKNPINIEEINFINNCIELKFQNQDYKITLPDAMMIYMLSRSNSIQEGVINKTELYYLREKRIDRKVKDSLFGREWEYSQGMGIWYNNLNFNIGGIGNDCCCLETFDYYIQPKDSIYQEGLPISKFVFDFICDEMILKLRNQYLNFLDAKILIRAVNTIKLYKLEDELYSQFLSIALSEKIQSELSKLYYYYETYYDQNNVKSFKLNDYSNKANFYNIIDFPEPEIKYKFK